MGGLVTRVKRMLMPTESSSQYGEKTNSMQKFVNKKMKEGAGRTRYPIRDSRRFFNFIFSK
jgi:hypothetical protein